MHLGIFKDHQCILRDHLCIFQEHCLFTLLSINPALLRAPGTEHQAKRFAEKIKSNDDHDDVDEESYDASMLASLIFIAAFGECRCEVGARAGVLLHQLRPHFLLES